MKQHRDLLMISLIDVIDDEVSIVLEVNFIS